MSMRFVHLPGFWNTDHAELIISFLDELREALWEVYGDEITEQRRLMAEENLARQADRHDLEFDDDIDF